MGWLCAATPAAAQQAAQPSVTHNMKTDESEEAYSLFAMGCVLIGVGLMRRKARAQRPTERR